MKKFILLTIITIIIISFIRFKYINYKSHDALYVASKYITQSASKAYRLYDVDSYNIEYTDDNTIVISIIGKKKIAPHSTNRCKLVLNKKSNGIWKVINIYNIK